jgi:peroxiredoxin
LQKALFALLISAVGAAFAADVPRPAPAYSYTVPGGKQINLQDYKGKVVALEFLLTTCPHCQRTSATMAKLHNEFGDKGFQPLGVAIDPNANVQQFANQAGAKYPIGTAPRDSAYGFLQQSIMGAGLMMPQLVLIDRAGTIRAQFAGTDPFFNNEEKNLRDWLTRLLAEPAAGAAKKTAAPAAKTTKSKKGTS